MKREMKKIQQISNTADKRRRSIRGRKGEINSREGINPTLEFKTTFLNLRKRRFEATLLKGSRTFLGKSTQNTQKQSAKIIVLTENNNKPLRNITLRENN